MIRDYQARKAHLVRLLGGECVTCGETADLHFDHVDPESKVFPISRGLAGRRWDSVLAEVKKCQLLCAPCHRTKSRDRDEIGGNRKIRRLDVLTIRHRRAEGEALKVIAADYGISIGQVSMIANRKRWAHVK